MMADPVRFWMVFEEHDFGSMDRVEKKAKQHASRY